VTFRRAKNPAPVDGIRAAVRGRVQVYRSELFGKLAASVKADGVEVWLDYNTAKSLDQSKVAALGQGDGARVVAVGRLEVRDLDYLVPTGASSPRGTGDQVVLPDSKPIKLRSQLVLVVESIAEAGDVGPPK